ncbi:CBS domain-containing protein [Acidianus sp. HS-5]|uniref:CBS domain-containing protein n=1 Tax=Acidianus sp. HS-5 TaxID=2886040 RepID=UPI001F1A2F2B|nr:CBS domain-containing protein [Acidianus sp. HS-5]BDC19027.1 CBS domain-containing protein [Acidianus sp. HS-5]
MQINGSKIISVSCQSTVDEAIFFMTRNNIRRIVIYCGDQISGIFTVDEALRNLLFKSEAKLKDIELKKAIRISSSDIFDVVRSMVKNNVDSVIYKDKIITEKDVVFSYSFPEIKISSIAKEALSVTPYTNVISAIEIMVKNGIRHLPVIEKEPVGMLSARDIIYYYSQKYAIDVPVMEVMNPHLICIEESYSLNKAIQVMKEHNIGSICVNGNKIVTLRDFIRYIFTTFQIK